MEETNDKLKRERSALQDGINEIKKDADMMEIIRRKTAAVRVVGQDDDDDDT